jgi:cysteine desulfurase
MDNGETVIYLDYAATTPPDPRAVEAMLPFLSMPANAGARHHAYGTGAHQAVTKARHQIAERLQTTPDHIIFTSGATEGSNLVIKGLANTLRAAGKTHIIAPAIEHKSVLEPLATLEGFTVTLLPAKACGMIEADMIAKAITPQTGLVCVQAVNNETGTIQPISEIATMLKGRNIFFYVDAAQALGKIDIDAPQYEADFITLSAHKAYGPQGIGALYIKDKSLSPLHHGGGQEQGLRSGTLPVALCAGFGTACTLITDDRARLLDLRTSFLGKISVLKPEIYGHSDPAWNVPGILNLRLAGIDSETLVMALPGLAFGLGAACTGAGNRYSHVIESLAGRAAATETIRLSFGRFTTADQMDQAANQIIAAVTPIRKLQEAA